MDVCLAATPRPSSSGNTTGASPSSHHHPRKPIIGCCSLSGYLLFPLLLFTACLGGLWSHFSTSHTVLPVRIILFGVMPLVLSVAVFARIRYVVAVGEEPSFLIIFQGCQN